MTTAALVLAAGRGARLNGSVPKPLYPVLGVPLIARTLFNLEAAGVRDAYIVLGHQAERVRQTIADLSRLSLRLHWLYNREWERENGLSVLAARNALPGPFILTMADHLFEPGIVRRLETAEPESDGLELCVDYRVDGVPDLEDATRVQAEAGRIVRIGKLLPEFNSVDTGVFLATPGLFEALEESARQGRCSLSDGVQWLADRGRARVRDVSGAEWLDVDTPAAVAEAERRLIAGLGKAEDGIVARVLNRPVSKAITRRLAPLPVTPNQVSVANLGLGLLAALAAAQGGYGAFLLAAVLFQVTSIVDGTDGELAKVKFMTSRWGEWLDTVCDSVAYVAFIVGLTVGVAKANFPDYLHLSAMVGFGPMLVGLGGLFAHQARRRSSGSFLALAEHMKPKRSAWSRIRAVLRPTLRRDFFSLVFLVLAVVGLLPLALPLFLVASVGLLAFSMWLNRGPLASLGRRAQQGAAALLRGGVAAREGLELQLVQVQVSDKRVHAVKEGARSAGEG